MRILCLKAMREGRGGPLRMLKINKFPTFVVNTLLSN